VVCASCRQIAEGILKQSGLEGYQLGTSKVFLRAGQMALLDKQRTEKLSKAAIQLQRHARGFLGRLHFKQSKEAVVRMQVRLAGCDCVWCSCPLLCWRLQRTALTCLARRGSVCEDLGVSSVCV
jgi:myosin-5